MKLIVTIEYRTRWGEELVCCLGDRRIRMTYASDGIWQGEAARFNPDGSGNTGMKSLRTARLYGVNGKNDGLLILSS